MYQVPQKRERLILIAIRNDIAKRVEFHWPTPYHEVLTLRDALYQSVIFDSDVPVSEGAQYPEKKSEFWQWFHKVAIGEICQKMLPRTIWEVVGCSVVENRYGKKIVT